MNHIAARCRNKPAGVPRRDPAVELQIDDRVYSRQCGVVPGFWGVIVSARGNGFNVRPDGNNGSVIYRDVSDLTLLSREREGRG